MKYLLLLPFLFACATIKPRPTLDSCRKEIKQRIDFDDSVKDKSPADVAYAEFGIAYMCNQNGFDADKTMKAVEDLYKDSKRSTPQ